MDSRDVNRRQADLDWLYGTERTPIDHTRVLDESEQAELSRRRSRLAGDERASAAEVGAAAARLNQDERDDAARDRDAGQSPAAVAERQRVVHTESPARPAAPATRRANPRPAASAVSRPVSAPPAPGRPAAPPPPASPAGASRPAARPANGRRRLPWVRLVLLALVAWLVWLLVVPMIALGRMPQIADQPEGSRPADQPGTLTLLVGSDARDDLTAEQQAELGTGTEAGKRTDTMMLLYTPPSGRPVLLSLPRDSYVAIPGHGHNKINAAYALGGPQLLVETIEADTGLRVDDYLEVGFDGFARVIDALGGITMCPSAPIKDAKAHLDLPAGCQNLDGPKALGYVRMRYADPTGDIGRMKRQQEMLAAMVKKAASPMTVVNPVRYWRLNMAAGSALARGEQTNTLDLVTALNSMRKVSGGDGLKLQIPIASSDTQTAAGSSILWDEQAAAELFAAIAKGDTSDLDEYAK